MISFMLTSLAIGIGLLMNLVQIYAGKRGRSVRPARWDGILGCGLVRWHYGKKSGAWIGTRKEPKKNGKDTERNLKTDKDVDLIRPFSVPFRCVSVFYFKRGGSVYRSAEWNTGRGFGRSLS